MSIAARSGTLDGTKNSDDHLNKLFTFSVKARINTDDLV